MPTFVFGTSGVKKNFFHIFVKTGTNIVAHPAEPTLVNGVTAIGADDPTGIPGRAGDLASGLIRDLYTSYWYEQIGSCKSEPKIGTADVQGIKNNLGTALGASKETTVEFTILDLDGNSPNENYLAAIGLEGKAANYIFVDENSGVVRTLVGVVASVNESTVGNGFEELPVVAKKESGNITDVSNRYKCVVGTTPAVITGKVMSVSISSKAGFGYDEDDNVLVQTAILTTGAEGSGFETTETTVGAGGALATVTIAGGGIGTGYRVGDLIVLDSGLAATSVAILRVESIAEV